MCKMQNSNRFLSPPPPPSSPPEPKVNRGGDDDCGSSTPISSSTSSSELPADYLIPLPNAPNDAAAEAEKGFGENGFPKPDLDWGNTKLYDRSQQVKCLREAFFRRWPLAGDPASEISTNKSTDNGAELVLISGASGTGKTWLARQVMQELVQKHKPLGYCLIGKYDQQLDFSLFQDDSHNSSSGFKKDAFRPSSAQPYSAFVVALTELAEYWEAEGPEKLVEIREKLGAKAAGGVDDDIWTVLRTLVPALECVFCSADDDKAQGPTESNRRTPQKNDSCCMHGAQQDQLHISLKSFFRTVLTPSQPVVLMLDDLQWSCTGSLELLETLTCDADLFDKLMIVGICRDNEVPYHHDFACSLRRLEDQEKATITNIEVHNLSLDATVELLVDLMRQPGSLCEEVATVIHKKTQGNCFFTLQILKALFEEGVLIAKETSTPSEQGGYEWEWRSTLWNQLFETHDLSACGLVFRRLQRLPQACQNLLKTASCFAAEIDRDILQSTVMDLFDEDEVHTLDSAFDILEREELLVPQPHHQKPGKLAFAHDRIQQASYALIPEGSLAMTHVSIGRALYEKVMASNDDGFLSENVFLIVKQLSCGVSLLDEQDKTGLATLCLRAGREAARSGAFLMSVQYFKLGNSYLPLRPWRDEYDLCLELNSSLAEAQCCITDFEAMEETIQEILKNGRNEQDKLRAYSTRIYAFAARIKLNEAIDMGVDVLSKFGETFPKNPNMFHLLVDLARTKWRLRNMSDEDILNLPTMTVDHEDKLAAQNILLVLMNHCFMSRPEFFPFVSLRLVNISLEYGLSAHASNSFVCFALFLLAVDEVENGYRFGELGIRLLREKFQDTLAEWLPKAYSIHYSCVAIWKQPIRQCLWGLCEGYMVGRKSGDAEAVAVSAQFICENKFYAGFPLHEVQHDLDEFLPIMAMYKQGPFFVSSRQLQELVWNLMGMLNNQLKDISHLTDSIRSTEVFSTLGTLDCEIKIHRLLLNYHLGNYEEALQMGISSRKAEQELKPVYSYSVQFFYDAMASLALAWDSNRRQRISHARKILKKLEKLASHNAASVQHMVYLIKAELSLLTCGKKYADKTMALYNKADQSATNEGFLHMKALALERAGVASLHFRKKSEGMNLLKQAKEAYQDWGAQAIVDSFEKRYIC